MFAVIHFIFKRLSPLYTPLSFILFQLLQRPSFHIYIQEAFSSLYPPFFYPFNFFQCPSFHIYIQEAFSSLYPLFFLPFQLLPVSFFSHFIFKRLSPLFFSTLLTSSGVRLLTFYIQEAFSSLYPPFFYAFNFFHCPSFHILDPRGFLLFIPPFLSISGFNFFKLSSFYSFSNCFGIHKFQNPIYFISAQPIPHTS